MKFFPLQNDPTLGCTLPSFWGFTDWETKAKRAGTLKEEGAEDGNHSASRLSFAGSLSKNEV